MSKGHRYFDLEASLDWIEPRIWRRFLLDERATFLDLHRAIQVAFDWANADLFAFFDDEGEVVAMKVRAARSVRDADDIRLLLGTLGLDTIDGIVEVVERYFPDDPQRPVTAPGRRPAR